MKPLQPIYRLIIGGLIALFISAVLIIWIDKPSNPTTPEQVTHQQTIDSVNRVWLERQRVYEDSLQQVLSVSSKTLRNAATKFANRANKLEGIAANQQAELEKLRQSAPEECKQIVDAYVKALDTCNSKAAAWHSAYSSEYLAHKQTLLKVNSLNRETEILDKANTSLKQTVATQRDYITGVTNRSERSLLFRNWKWLWGNWNDYVLGK